MMARNYIGRKIDTEYPNVPLQIPKPNSMHEVGWILQKVTSQDEASCYQMPEVLLNCSSYHLY